MAGAFSIILRSNRIQEVLIKLTDRTEATVDAVAAEIQTRASSLAPVDTGALRNSIYRSNGDESDYRDKAGSASSLKDDAVIVPEVNPDLVISASGSNEASYMVVVGSAVQHAAVQEFGSAFLRSQPFMLPATLAMTDELVRQLSGIANDL